MQCTTHTHTTYTYAHSMNLYIYASNEYALKKECVVDCRASRRVSLAPTCFHPRSVHSYFYQWNVNPPLTKDKECSRILVTVGEREDGLSDVAIHIGADKPICIHDLHTCITFIIHELLWILINIKFLCLTLLKCCHRGVILTTRFLTFGQQMILCYIVRGVGRKSYVVLYNYFRFLEILWWNFLTRTQYHR